MDFSPNHELSPAYIKLAKRQLGEDPENVSAHIEALRRWVGSMPHLKCPTDDEFLLMFLRHAKFSHSKAQARLDNYCTLSTSKGIGDYILASPLDLKSKNLEYYLNLGMHLPLGYMKDGALALMIRPGVWDPDQVSLGEAFTYAYRIIMMAASDPRTQVGGMVIVLDFTDMTSKQNIGSPNDIRTLVRFGQEAVPLRIRRNIFYNESKFMDAMINVFIFYMREKMRNRMLRCGKNLNIAYESEPDLKAVIPSELGGGGKSFKELIEENKKYFMEFYSKYDPTSTIRVDESKRPSSAKSFMHEYKDYDADVMGKSGTYIKIKDEI